MGRRAMDLNSFCINRQLVNTIVLLVSVAANLLASATACPLDHLPRLATCPFIAATVLPLCSVSSRENGYTLPLSRQSNPRWPLVALCPCQVGPKISVWVGGEKIAWPGRMLVGSRTPRRQHWQNGRVACDFDASLFPDGAPSWCRFEAGWRAQSWLVSWWFLAAIGANQSRGSS